ncbi:hypothetical protein K7X08_001014 [Anisodus acutangulus]|uniref:Uncharacterized protein n=1 Tax=Anisodus acutangulus TaxID=402998 RepID=A0A9Q1MMX3_9SOLA|nr:hypothetical protein K7X08_001014 [Anisodus acutangulus]
MVESRGWRNYNVPLSSRKGVGCALSSGEGIGYALSSSEGIGYALSSSGEGRGVALSSSISIRNELFSSSYLSMKAIQKGIKKGRFKLADKSITEISVDTDPFPTIPISMVSFAKLDQSKDVKGKQPMKTIWVQKKPTSKEGVTKTSVFDRLGSLRDIYEDTDRQPARSSFRGRPYKPENVVREPHKQYSIFKRDPADLRSNLGGQAWLPADKRSSVPQIGEEPLPMAKQRVAEFNVKEGIYFLCITMREDGQLRPRRMIKPTANIEEGKWFINHTSGKKEAPPGVISQIAEAADKQEIPESAVAEAIERDLAQPLQRQCRMNEKLWTNQN